MIYGVALLAGCMLVGSFFGNILGILTGIDKDIGGIGFAMLLLLVVTNSKKLSSMMPKNYEKGIEFWKEMFIPIVVAMSAAQNVANALSSGVLALVAGLGVVVFSFLLIPVFNLFAPKDENKPQEADKEEQA